MLRAHKFGFSAAAALLLMAPAIASGQTQAVNAKWLTVVLPAEPEALEACNATRSLEGFVNKQTVVETLIDKDYRTGALKPRIAVSWERVNPTTWNFKLRQGVTFHDGAKLDAKAVAYSMDRTLNSPIHCELRGKFFGGLKLQVSALNDDTVQVVTDKPEPILDARMTGMTIYSPNTPFDKSMLTAVGTGPYAMESWQAGQEIRLKRFDKYWGAQPQAEGVRYVWRAESAVRAAMVKIGEADIAPFVTKDDAKDPDFARTYLSWEVTYLRLDTGKAPLNDRRVRLALNYAFDRESVRGSILSKDVVHATQMVVPGLAGHNDALDKMIRPYDPAKAKALIAEAKADGVPVDTEIVLYGAPHRFSGANEVMEAFLTMYKAIGLNVKLTNLEPGQYNKAVNKPFAEDRPPTALLNLHDNTLDPVISVTPKYTCAGTTSMVCDKTVDDTIAKVTAMTGEERVKGWQELFRMMYEDVASDVWMYYMVGYANVGKRVNYANYSITNNEVRVADFTFK